MRTIVYVHYGNRAIDDLVAVVRQACEQLGGEDLVPYDEAADGTAVISFGVTNSPVDPVGLALRLGAKVTVLASDVLVGRRVVTYLAFGGRSDEPKGGAEDLVGSFASMEGAHAAVGLEQFDWAQIVAVVESGGVELLWSE